MFKNVQRRQGRLSRPSSYTGEMVYTAQRIGIFSGTFNPVHAGHIAFALQAIEVAQLDMVYFLPERKSRSKIGVEHMGHRAAMLSRALQPHPKLDILELDDVSFTILRTLPNLQTRFADSELVFLFGSDAVVSMPQWPHIENLIAQTELIVGRRSSQTVAQTRRAIAALPGEPKVTLINSYAPDVSSSAVREALYTRKQAKGLLKSVARYSDHHWLYVSVAE